MPGVDILPRFGKRARVQDTKLMDEVRQMPCVISGAPGPNDPSHVSSVGSHADDVPWNICPLAHKYHVELHNSGASTFAKKYPAYKAWLIKNGWEYNELLDRWLHPENKGK